MAILYLLDAHPHQAIFDSLEHIPADVNVAEGELNIARTFPDSVLEPVGVGFIHLPRDKPSDGGRWLKGGAECAIASCDGDAVKVRPIRNWEFPPAHWGELLPANYQVFHPCGVSFPIAAPSCPSGMGRTLILDSNTGLVRSLSMKGCWRFQGGTSGCFPTSPSVTETSNRILPGKKTASQLYLVGLAAGAFFVLGSHLDSGILGKLRDAQPGVTHYYKNVDMHARHILVLFSKGGTLEGIVTAGMVASQRLDIRRTGPPAGIPPRHARWGDLGKSLETSSDYFDTDPVGAKSTCR